MKVLFINNATTHYYNLLLNRLHAVPGLEVTLIVPTQATANVGVGVYQTREGVDFKICELPEKTRFGSCSSFQGIARAIWRERPAIILVSEAYMIGLMLNVPAMLTLKVMGIKLVMRSIPFRVPLYQDAIKMIRNDRRGFSFLPGLLSAVVAKLQLARLFRWLYLQLIKLSFRVPDGHVNYIDDALRIYGSYGVHKGRIYVTGNSPDTDTLLAARAEIEQLPPILPPCEHRLIHVGRLVGSKRVDLLLRAHARLKKEFPDAQLLVVGEGPEEASLRKLMKDLGVEDSVQFVPGVYKPRQLGRYLLASSIYVLAGMGGLSINDAMCFGLPVICSACDGTEKVLVRDEFNGKFFRNGDEEDLVEKIGYLLRNPELRKKMGRNSTDIIRNEVNIQSVIAGYVKAFEAIAGRGIKLGGR